MTRPIPPNMGARGAAASHPNQNIPASPRTDSLRSRCVLGPDRSLAEYLRIVRGQRGFYARLGAATCFVAASWVGGSHEFVLILLPAFVFLELAVLYPLWRRRGN